MLRIASWADCLAMVQQRHPSVAEEMIVGLDRDPAPCLAAVRHCREVLAEANFHPPGWRDLAVVVPDRVEDVEPNQPKFGWQQCASRSLETKHLNERVWPGMLDAERALLRSQRGPLASAAVTALPTSRATRMDGQPFRILLLRRLRLPLPLSSRTCRCGRHLDPLGHPRTTRGKNNIVRVSVKASPAEGRRRLHTNTAYVRLSGFNGPSCGASPAEGRRCFT